VLLEQHQESKTLTAALFGQPTPFAELIDWAWQRLDTRQLDAEAVRIQAEAITHHGDPCYRYGCFEYHHDDSGRVDFSLLCDPHRDTFGAGFILPHWFNALQQRILKDTAERSNYSQPSKPALVLGATQWIEFDQSEQGLTLAGIWQGVHRPPTLPTTTAIEQLAETLAVTPLGDAAIKRCTRLAALADIIGFPKQIGIMSGRPDGLKALAGIDLAQPEPIRDFLRHADFRGAFDSCGGADRIVSALGSLAGFTASLNIDINVKHDRLTSIGIELTPTDLGRAKLNASVLPALADGFGLRPEQIRDSKTVMSTLPCATRRRRRCSALGRLLAPDLEERLLLARFSHLKIVLKPGKLATLKTYVGLIVRWVMATDTAPTQGHQ